ncbi:MAG TPA: HAMP domain-containing sensor histidine kinase [Solirubrobacteraceae bacterium]|jgi:two-component system sensor histidine kinase MprB|nr:HAMP domain-containing sensor histidine kinase [Solirubrobacteraceae bacterium]
MSFRRRMVLLAAGAVAAAVVIASVVVYVVTRDELRGQIDASLRQKLTPGEPQAVQVKTQALSGAQLAKLEREGKLPKGALSSSRRAPASGSASSKAPARGSTSAGASELTGRITALDGQNVVVWSQSATGVPPPGALPQMPSSVVGFAGGLVSPAPPSARGGHATVRVVLPPQKLGGATGYAQLVEPGGQVLRSDGGGTGLPVSAAARAVAAGRRPAFFSDATVAGTHVRVLTERAPPNGVWQVALPLTEVESTLSHLELVLAAVCLGGVALAAVLGLLVSRGALIPVRRLTSAAERVARTQDLGHRIRAGEEDELGRLAASFNAMLAALERSRLAQRQLISDASHELRTPLTSVQANLDALAIGEGLSPRERARAVAAAQAQLHELTVLVGDLVDLSNTEVDEVEVEDVRLDLAAAAAVERARLHAPRSAFALDAEPCLVRAAPARLDRAIANLLDNASKWSPPSPPAEPIEVRVREGRLEVRDRGSGIAEEDLPRVFDRFYRAAAARGLPGSGLGLAIVRQVAETHNGAVHVVNDPGGGARLTLELPPLKMTDGEFAGAKAEGHRRAGVHRVPRLL